MSPRTFLSGFRSVRPEHQTSQEEILSRLAAAHAAAEVVATVPSGSRPERRLAFEALLARYGCGPAQIASRGHALEDFASIAGRSLAERTAAFARAAGLMLEELYPPGGDPPEQLIHVTCTGYVAPSPAQRLAAGRAWPTRITHAYGMGCAAAFPAVHLAAALAAEGPVDVVHTEFCSLHLDASESGPEQLVAQGLFADGGIKYRVASRRPAESCLELVAQREILVPGTEDAMTWTPGPAAMRMTLSKELPALVRGLLRPFIEDLLAEAGLVASAVKDAVFAVHPGGPRIIDAARDALGLSDGQVAWSRRVLRDYGNMSSATIPHVWREIVADPAVPVGTLVPSVAFGPGLTVAGALFRKR